MRQLSIQRIWQSPERFKDQHVHPTRTSKLSSASGLTGVCKINETLRIGVSFILQAAHSPGWGGLKMRSYLNMVKVSGDENVSVLELRVSAFKRR